MRRRFSVWLVSAVGALIGFGIGQALGWDGLGGLVLSLTGALGGAYAGTYISVKRQGG